ncbi:ABC transporter ATP-binding protein [Nocardioides sp. AE5]|uniref:ABC transporter ATP-binding protein n=1 Tax=Nocardioides sp. AE5 TaxID=2962573 RepID=UPI002880E5F9|nr:ABC transporter ATP-binding protein [Nocardioides sp. AE5]MDT0202186.1 ABC transporter ATP-binding protein [Nocardioides sp. AE5]
MRDVDLTVPRGGRVALVGPNGSGKSTLLRALTGVDRPHAGEVLLKGRPLASFTARERARQMAVVSQHEAPPADLLVRELVALGRLPHRSPWSSEPVDDHAMAALERLDLAHFADRAVDQLSGGELRRVLLARALAQDVDLLVLDEPTNHLDLRHQHELLATVRDLDVTVIAAIHDLHLAARYLDEVVVLHQGRVHGVGDPEEALSAERVAEVFGVHVARVRHPVTGRLHLLVEPEEVVVDPARAMPG